MNCECTECTKEARENMKHAKVAGIFAGCLMLIVIDACALIVGASNSTIAMLSVAAFLAGYFSQVVDGQMRDY